MDLTDIINLSCRIFPFPDRTAHFRALMNVIYATFQPVFGGNLADYLGVATRLWPVWLELAEAMSADGPARLTALIKPYLTAELELVGGLPRSHTIGAPLSSSQAAGGVVSPPKPKDGADLFFSSPTKSVIATPTKGSSSSWQPTVPAISNLGRWLLIAAYLCGYNPPRTDVRIFAAYDMDDGYRRKKKRFGGARKSGATEGSSPTKKGRRDQRRFLGPKPFTLERMLAVAETLLPDGLEGAAESADLASQVR
jgi:Origin recognition complex (ORC) subunit 5 C-terminus